MPQATFLLPGAAEFGAQRLSAGTAVRLGRADRSGELEDGRRAQLRRHFALPAGGWPIAALSRAADSGDAGDSVWLRADPAHLRPDLNGVRLMAHGSGLGLSDADPAALLPALLPVLADAGMALDAPVPARWYLRLPPGTVLPDFSDPSEALGADLFDHDPVGEQAGRWRTLSAELQIVLHNHPWNQRRAEQGRLPVNALWFWGGGALPDQAAVDTAPRSVFGDDPTLVALGGVAGCSPLPDRYEPGARDALFDLASIRDLAKIDDCWLQPALAALDAGDIGRLLLDLGDGRQWILTPRSRWRWWRRSRAGFSP